MTQELKVESRQVPPAVVLDLRGDVTIFAEAELTGAYHRAQESGARTVILNFASTDYINSAGIAILISLLTVARASGTGLVLCGLSPHYQKIFRMVGLTQYAALFETEDEALAGLKTDEIGESAAV